MSLIETYNYKGYTVNIEVEDNTINLRDEGENRFGTIVGYHKHYNFTDKRFIASYASSWEEAMLYYFGYEYDIEIRNYLESIYPNDTELVDNLMYCIETDNQYEPKLMEHIKEWIELNIVHLPVYMFEHGDIRVRTTPFNSRWDSGQLGFIYIKLDNEEIVENKYTKEQIVNYLNSEVKLLDYYVSGDIYEFFIYDNDDNLYIPIDSCSGFYGTDFETNGLYETAREFIDSNIEQIKNERIRIIDYIKNELKNYSKIIIKNTSYLNANLVLKDNILYSNNTNVEEGSGDLFILQIFKELIDRKDSITRLNTQWSIDFIDK